MGKFSEFSERQSRSPRIDQRDQSQFLSQFSKYVFRCGLGLFSIVAGMAPSYQAMAQTATLEPTIPQAFNDAFYSNADTFFGNRSLGGQLSLILGIPGFPENQIRRDGRAVDRLYQEVLEQQVASDPTLRTPDLPNPFSGSLLTTPLIAAEEPIPPAPPPVIFQQPSVAPPLPPAPARPVPALW
ncbi:hypothetical protein [Leptolyngbya ohadii]|uniref:hypothetical protein n=1 Tax=Leptolyngbya ohadii TaxID=1962290 RepID=UPI000B5A157F|nr:hypothetical protein [Leptolyngbya ohadii]